MRKRALEEEKQYECRVSFPGVGGDMIEGIEIEKTLSGRTRRIAHAPGKAKRGAVTE